MKRVISLITAVVMFGAFLAMPTNAEEVAALGTTVDDASADAYYMDLFLSVFPEHTDHVDSTENQPCSQLQTENMIDEVIYEESRAISSTTTATYTEYASGRSLASIFVSSYINITNEIDNGSYVRYTCNAWMTYIGSNDSAIVNGIVFNVYTSGANALISDGTPSGTQGPPVCTGIRYSGTASDSAYVEYTCYFLCDWEGTGYTYLHQPVLKVYIDDNEPAVTHIY